MIEWHHSRLVYAGRSILDVSSGAYTQLLSLSSDGRSVFASRGSAPPMNFVLCNVLFRRADAARLDFLHNRDNFSSDSGLFLKLALEGEAAAVRKDVCVYRMHAGSLTKRIRSSP